MYIFRSPEDIRNNAKISTLLKDSFVGVTIGNFDGFHLGHQTLFKELNAHVVDGQKVLLTFTPHPRIVLGNLNSREVPEITTLRTKVTLSKNLGFDIYFAARFSKLLSTYSPEEFVQKYLVEALRVDHVVVGYDWAFGKGRAGTAETLQNLGHKFGFRTSIIDPIIIDGNRVSSTLVKNKLELGEVFELKKLLGREFTISGRVIHGDGRGKTIGVPTANIYSPRQLLPKDGVYATTLLCAGKSYPSVSNIGIRPTFLGDTRRLEVHIIGEDSLNLYQQHVDVTFLKRIRDEQKFSGIEELKAQIDADIETACKIHGL